MTRLRRVRKGGRPSVTGAIHVHKAQNNYGTKFLKQTLKFIILSKKVER